MTVNRKLRFAMALIGAVLLGIGLYFLLCQAGPPYQDPTPEMLARYEAYLAAGRTASLWGTGLLAAGAAERLLCRNRNG